MQLNHYPKYKIEQRFSKLREFFEMANFPFKCFFGDGHITLKNLIHFQLLYTKNNNWVFVCPVRACMNWFKFMILKQKNII